MDSTPKIGRLQIFAMPGDTPVKVSAHRYFSAHHMMIGAARASLPNTRNPQYALVVIAMCAMAAEALANAVGQRIFPEWKDLDTLSPWGKYRVICRELKIPCNKGEGVWQNLNALLKLRNLIAHAKPEYVETSSITTVEQYNSPTWFMMHPFPSSELESVLTYERAKECLDTIDLVLTTVVNALDGDDKEFIAGDIAQHEIALAESSGASSI